MALAERILDAPFVRKNNAVRSFLTAAWLGWQIESNWADPFLFAVYSIARPLAGMLILVVMYSVISNGDLANPLFAYIYLGNALYILVGMVITGVSWVIIEDREHYRVAKQLHTISLNHYFYLMGRGVARLIIGTISVLITIGFGMVVFKLPITFTAINWGLLIASTTVGVIMLAAIGLILGAVTMMMARHFWSVGDAVAGGLYLFSGAIFPLEVLPAWLRPIGFIFPVTYWLELARRALLGPGAIGFPTLAALSEVQLMGILIGSTILLIIASVYIYRASLKSAKTQGILDLESGY